MDKQVSMLEPLDVLNPGWCYTETLEAPHTGTISDLRYDAMEMPQLKDGTFLTKLISVAVDLPGPFQGLAGKRVNAMRSCPVHAEVVARVVESKSDKYKVGGRVWLPCAPLVNYAVHRDDGQDTKDGDPPVKLSSSIRTETQLAAFSAGLAAISAIKYEECRAAEESASCCGGGFSGLLCSRQKTVLVTSAHSAVGIVACQFYNNRGFRVIGMTSTSGNAQKLLGFGCHAAIARATEDLDARLSELAPGGLDVVFDNDQTVRLDARHMKADGHILQPSNIKDANWKKYQRMGAKEKRTGMHDMRLVETVVHGGLERWPDCIRMLSDDQTFGRLILTISDTDHFAMGA